MNNCIIYIKNDELSKWSTYMYKLRTLTPDLPPTFRASLTPDEPNIWVQMIIELDDLQRIYDLMDEYAMMAEAYNETTNNNKI